MNAIDDELEYLSFRTAKMLELPSSGIAAHFGSHRAEKMEARYQAEAAAGLIPRSFPDVARVCGTCGAKHCSCPPMTRSKWLRECR